MILAPSLDRVPEHSCGGSARLVAYGVLGAGECSTLKELKVLWVTCLPDYMIPAAFVTVDALPVKRHGKVRHGALTDARSGQPIARCANSGSERD